MKITWLFLCYLASSAKANEAFKQAFDSASGGQSSALNSWLQQQNGAPLAPEAKSPATSDLAASSSSLFDTSEDNTEYLDEGGSYTRRKYRRKGTKRAKNKQRRRNKFKFQNTFAGGSTGFGTGLGSGSGLGSADTAEYYDEDSEYYDRDDGYGAPKAPSYSAPSNSYEAPSYSPQESYGAPSYGGGGGDGFNDFLNALAAFLPIGLFLAAIPPNLITVSTRKKRDLDAQVLEKSYDFPFLAKINEIGYERLREDGNCQKRLFCEMSQMGRQDSDANLVQKIFYSLVQWSPQSLFGSSEVLKAIEQGNCASFKC